METDSQKDNRTCTLGTSPFVLGVFLLAWVRAAQYGLTGTGGDGYLQRRSTQTIVELIAQVLMLLNVKAFGNLRNFKRPYSNVRTISLP
jgi:hypothetical protein